MSAIPVVQPARAQEAASVLDEVRALRQLIELQAKQIQSLTDQVARLALQLGDRNASPAAATPAAAEVPPPAARVVAPPQPPANVHIVVKGDSLDKIAKQHNITVAELLKINKITDPKKLQIGQQIILPATAAPVAAPAPAPGATPATPVPGEKKEGQ